MKGKAGAFPHAGSCAHPDCDAPGEYRAPVDGPGRRRADGAGPPQWQYFCLQHVRDFNAGWDYFAGMDDSEIWAAQSPYPNWERETRVFAHNAGQGDFEIRDPLGVLRWKVAGEGIRPEQTPPLSRAERQALAALGLAETATLADIKAKYRQLARRYHPDANAGSRNHEARFQKLTEAYALLCASSRFASR